MNRIIRLLLGMAVIAFVPGMAMAQAHICAYANDDITASDGLNNIPNTVDGYNIVGTKVTYLEPVTTTNGYGVGGGYFSGDRGAARVMNNDLYIQNDYSRTIAHLIINPANCALTYDNDYPDGDTVSSRTGDPLVVTPNGKYLYVADNGNFYGGEIANIELLQIAPNGSLGAPVPQSIPVAGSVAQLAISGNGKILVATIPEMDEVCAYTVAANGSLGAAPNCQGMGGFATGITIDATGKCVYVGENTVAGQAASVAAASLSATGTLGPFTEYNGTLGTGKNSNDVTLSSTGKYLFIANNSSNQITAARVGPDCTLAKGTVSATGGTAGRDYPGQIAVSGNTVVVGDFNLTGSLTMPSMGVYNTTTNGSLKSLTTGSALHPLTTVQLAVPLSVVIAVESAE
jgi:6-phosphogluconolactonase (cycloisomerase 2 family)